MCVSLGKRKYVFYHGKQKKRKVLKNIQDCELEDYEIQVNVKSKTLKKKTGDLYLFDKIQFVGNALGVKGCVVGLCWWHKQKSINERCK